jgi:hypothetical protein
MEKRPYCEPSFGIVEVMDIGKILHMLVFVMCFHKMLVSAFDESTIALQEMGKHEFLEPLSWDFLPSDEVLTTVRCVLWLFGIDSKNIASKNLWPQLWAPWIVRNIDLHLSGWEWAASNEPVGLFTKPYDLNPYHLEDIQLSLPTTYRVPPEEYSWQRMPAYLRLRNWATCASAYVHMTQHCLPDLEVANHVRAVTAAPKRTPKENVWFVTHTEDGVPYYYHRHLQTVVFDEPKYDINVL